MNSVPMEMPMMLATAVQSSERPMNGPMNPREMEKY
jgi:hypothetical protein